MSTFRGVVSEFPRIRIDYFRTIPEKPPPLACFLSHVHSDHLLGLESLKSPFVYCSPATKELLLRLEKYPHRMNFAKGILETRKQTYKHLKTRLKTIPLDTPTTIELSPGNEICVTFFNANHCAGAVMILIKDKDNAILYTGDVRSEKWWVETLKQHPLMIEHIMGLRTLDKMYLDTTFATKSEPYRRFPSKAEGLGELLGKVSEYPKDTVFHFNAWTFGYEEAWIALSAALQTPIHLDQYRLRLYNAFAPRTFDEPPCIEYPALCGYRCGNRHQQGCLTSDTGVRLHSCERGSICPLLDMCKDFVQITPIIGRLPNGLELLELGAGGGVGDLNQVHELEINDEAAVAQLISLCSARLKDRASLAKVVDMLTQAVSAHKSSIALNVAQSGDVAVERVAEVLQDDLPLEKLIDILREVAMTEVERSAIDGSSGPRTSSDTGQQALPRKITFPYSRHSSYEELCLLVDAFKPRDVYPCTVDESNWTVDVSMRSLFGHLCSAQLFVHDEEMKQKRGAAPTPSLNGACPPSSQRTEGSETESEPEPLPGPKRRRTSFDTLGTASSPIIVPDGSLESAPQRATPPDARENENLVVHREELSLQTTSFGSERPVQITPTAPSNENEEILDPTAKNPSAETPNRARRLRHQRAIYDAMVSSDVPDNPFELVSSYDNHSTAEVEL